MFNFKYSKKKYFFSRFPLSNPELLDQWVKAVRRATWQPTKYSFLCSDHFALDSYKSGAKRYLKNGAVPTIFNFPSHLKKIIPPSRRKIVKHVLPVS